MADHAEKFVSRTAKDSVFRDLFSDKKYLLALYRVLHPEDTTATEDDLTYLTLEKILTNGIYNDLSFTVGNRLMLIIEQQSNWSVNIIVRCVMYLGRIWAEYFKTTEQSVYASTPLSLPEPEFYVVYTGEAAVQDGTITFSDVYFEGKETDLDVRLHVVTDGRQGDILNQYVVFTRVLNE